MKLEDSYMKGNNIYNRNRNARKGDTAILRCCGPCGIAQTHIRAGSVADWRCDACGSKWISRSYKPS